MSRPPAVLLALALLPLTGCFGGSGDDAAPTVAPPPPPTAEAYTGVSVADAVEHIHDYWADRDQVVLLDADFTTPAAGSREWFRSMFFSMFFRQRPTTGYLEFTLPDNTAVYEGTGKLIVEVDSTAALKQGQQILTYSSGATNYETLQAQPAVAMWEIALTPEMSDPPHSQATRWSWLLEPDGTAATLDGPVHVKVTAVKGYEPDQWPAHPDFWQNRSHMWVANNWTGSFGGTEVLFFVGERQGMEELVIPNGQLVPPGTRSIAIDLTYDFDGSPSNAQYDGMFLYFHGADSRRPSFGEPVERDANHARYVFQVTDPMVDSPYVGETAWRFYLGAHPKTDTGTGTPVDFTGYLVQAASGTWTIDVKVFDHDLPEAQPARGMGDDDPE